MSHETMEAEATEKGKRRGRQGPHLKGGSQDARQVAALVLEALAGAKTPSEVAGLLRVSLPRYYVLELRALKGLLAACEPRAKGPGKNAEREAERLRKEVSRLEREVQRQQALARVTQRAIGLRGAAPSEAGKKKGRRRRPTVRGLRAADHLRAQEASEAVLAGKEG